MMRRHLTPPDAILVHVGEAALDASVAGCLAYFVYLGRSGYSAGVTIDARRLQPTVNN
jgi:hypothetical protein